MDLGKMIRVAEAAARLGVNVSAVYQSIKDENGKLRGAKVGSAWWVVESDVANYSPREYPRSPEGGRLGGADYMREGGEREEL